MVDSSLTVTWYGGWPGHMMEHGCLVGLGLEKTHLAAKHNCCTGAAGRWYPCCLRGVFEDRLVLELRDRVVWVEGGGGLTVSVCLNRRLNAKEDVDNREAPVWLLKFDAWR